MVERFDVYLVSLDPAQGSEIKKSRPCVVVSPDEMNHALSTVIIVPMTSTVKNWPSRIELSFKGKRGEVALDQIRTVDKVRLYKKLGNLPAKTGSKISAVLVEMFAF